MKLSVAIPYYDNLQYIEECVNPLLSIDLIDDIVITHDCSNDWDELQKLMEGKPKVRLFKNEQNLHILLNKHSAISKCKNDWVCCLDSDNIANADYFDAFHKNFVFTQPHKIYAPEFAMPNFDYRCISPSIIRKDFGALKNFAAHNIFQCFLNTFNYIINKNKYLEVFEYCTDCRGADSIYFNYLWLKKGYSIFVVPGMQYFHRVHDKSTFMAEVDHNMNKANEYYNLILNLSWHTTRNE